MRIPLQLQTDNDAKSISCACGSNSEASAVEWCFPSLNDPHDCANKKILCPTNAAVDAFNTVVLRKLTEVYLLPHFIAASADSLEHEQGRELESHLTAEFLNAQSENGGCCENCPTQLCN